MAEIDLQAIREREKQKWLRDRARRKAFVEKVDDSVPWWLVIVVLGVMFLSVPHTVSTWSKLLPFGLLGFAAPLVVEFGLLYTSFYRRKLKRAKQRTPLPVVVLEILFFVMSIVVNGAGSLDSVVHNLGVSNLSFTDIVGRFSTFPVISQAAFLLVPIAAIIVPIATVVGGEGLASLVLEREHEKDTTDGQWDRVSAKILYTAFYDALVGANVPVHEAKDLASAHSGWTPQDKMGRARRTVSGTEAKTVRDVSATDSVPNGKEGALDLLRANPALYEHSLRTLEAQTGISKSVWSLAKQEFSKNGHRTTES